MILNQNNVQDWTQGEARPAPTPIPEIYLITQGRACLALYSYLNVYLYLYSTTKQNESIPALPHFLCFNKEEI